MGGCRWTIRRPCDADVRQRETQFPNSRSAANRNSPITTPALTLTYLKNGKFQRQNLKAVFTLNGREVVWTPGMENLQNLLGTTRTLDGADGSKLKEPMEQGILSRAGWSLIDDSQRHVLTPDGSGMGRVGRSTSRRPSGPLPFAYGHDQLQTGAGRLRARRRPCADASRNIRWATGGAAASVDRTAVFGRSTNCSIW